MQRGEAIISRGIEIPNLPQQRVTLVAVSEMTPASVVKALQALSIKVMKVTADNRFTGSVSSHADMRCHLTGSQTGFCTDESLRAEFLRRGISLFRTNVHKFSKYPEDCSLNAARVGSYVFANPRCMCKELQKFYKEEQEQQKIEFIPVRQGYTKCNIAVVDERSIITEDNGIAAAARKAGLDVLQLRPGMVQLDGYPYGFIGGSCGKLAPNVLAFAGSVWGHPQVEQIIRFLKEHHVRALSLGNGLLQDIGGILPVKEKELENQKKRNYTK